MKNRTILGVIFSILALVIMFVVAPFFTQLATNDISCVRLKADVLRGTQITAAHLEEVSVPSYAIPAGAYKSASEVVGKYAASTLYAGDYLTTGKLSATSISAADALENIEDGKVAMSIPISSFSGSLSGKLQNGDIVQIWIRREPEEAGGVFVPAELQWVEVITTTTGDGIDKDQIVVNSDGSFSMPSTVTVIVSELQAQRLVEYKDYEMFLTLVHRGTEERAQEFLDMQDKVLEELLKGKEEEKETEEEQDEAWVQDPMWENPSSEETYGNENTNTTDTTEEG